MKTVYSCQPQVNVQNYVALLHKWTFTFKGALTICWGNFYLSLRCYLSWESVPSVLLRFVSFFDLYLAGILKGGRPYSEGGVNVRRKELFSSNNCLKTLPSQYQQLQVSMKLQRPHPLNGSVHRQQAALETNRKNYWGIILIWEQTSCTIRVTSLGITKGRIWVIMINSNFSQCWENCLC